MVLNHNLWSSIMWNHIRWPEVSFEIQLNEAIRQNLHFWLNFKRNLSVRRTASICTNCDVVTSGAQESTVLSAFICSDNCCFYFVLLVTTRLIQGKPEHVLEHKQKKWNEFRSEKKRNKRTETSRRIVSNSDNLQFRWWKITLST